ncbi:hypothetical protein F511_24164 [Dorcoceras hygrometricum]|uniref:RING-type E3 ubiquitin transferase n=1 Tax=Dorcoceras hygrometricum TaxID=472368 RepID=A0A2Z7CDK6_9LAMI|nr:hypothetical protein F511_24164 [Dorcoceras hygrometricum]
MVLISEEINGLKLRVFKWNEVLPKKTNSNSNGFFFLRIYEHTIKQGQNGVISNGFSMVPILIPFDPVYLSCHCYIRTLSRLLISYPKMFPPEEIEALAKNISDLILTGFRFRRATTRGEGTRPVIVVEIYRTKTLDFTQVGSDDDDYWQEIYENEIEKQYIFHECYQNNPEDGIASENQEMEELSNCDEIWKVAYENEVLDILRSMKSRMKICHHRCLKAIRDDEPKGLYEVRPRVEMKVCRASELKMEECPVCLQRFGDGVEIVETPCAHVFHAQCIFAWLLKNVSCPMCRSVCIRFV